MLRAVRADSFRRRPRGLAMRDKGSPITNDEALCQARCYPKAEFPAQGQ